MGVAPGRGAPLENGPVENLAPLFRLYRLHGVCKYSLRGVLTVYELYSVQTD